MRTVGEEERLTGGNRARREHQDSELTGGKPGGVHRTAGIGGKPQSRGDQVRLSPRASWTQLLSVCSYQYVYHFTQSQM